MTSATVRRLRFAACVAVFGLALAADGPGNARAGVIVGYAKTQPSPNNPTGPAVYDPRFDRFSTDFPTEAPLANTSPAFVAGVFDLSGIGWLTSRPTANFALISPRHFVAASHSQTFTQGASVSFFTGSGTSSSTVTRTVASVAPIPSTAGSTNPLTDMVLGTLNADVPAGINFYPIPVGLRGQYLGAQSYHYDAEHRVGLNNVSGFQDNSAVVSGTSTNLIGYDFNPNGPPGEIVYIGGDSDGPSFLNVNGRFTYIGPHLAVDETGIMFSFDGFLPEYVPQLSTMMAANSPYTPSTVPVPEPTALVLTATAAGLTGAAGLLRKRRSRPAGAA